MLLTLEGVFVSEKKVGAQRKATKKKREENCFFLSISIPDSIHSLQRPRCTFKWLAKQLSEFQMERVTRRMIETHTHTVPLQRYWIAIPEYISCFFYLFLDNRPITTLTQSR